MFTWWMFDRCYVRNFRFDVPTKATLLLLHDDVLSLGWNNFRFRLQVYYQPSEDSSRRKFYKMMSHRLLIFELFRPK